ncbi:MAG TPA: ABC transporter permease subunit [Pirellulales bacterium]|nr:ABC transporter permease subunit [Pirellulales bacterium]
MFVGPVFTREVATAPRRARLYLARAAYVAVLLVLTATAWEVLAGTQVVRNVGDLARFGAVVFQILAPLQLAVVMFFAALSAASAVAAEKDRQTLILLLLTNLSNTELVLGKLLASMLNVLVLIASALPVFMLLVLLGGVSFAQVIHVFAVTLAGALAAGSLGALLAFWREKTFQTLAMTALALVFWLTSWEAVARGALGESWLGVSCQTWAVGFSPWQAMLEAMRPIVESDPALGPIRTSVNLFLLLAVAMTIGQNLIAIAMVRVWNPSREMRRDQEASKEKPVEAAQHVRRPGKTREVWDNPIIWREVRTWAYGRKIIAVRVAYLVLAALALAGLYSLVHQPGAPSRNDLALILAPFGVLSLVLLNAQAVTSLTSERDAKAIDLLLVTDLSPSEFIYGKLGGVFYNAKEIWLLPMAMCVYLWSSGVLGLENLLYLLGGWLSLCAFAAMLGVHSGMNYVSSRGAIAVSLGTVFFLFVGVAVCMRIMVAFSGSFQVQLQPFLAFMVGGGIGLYAALGIRNPSPAIQFASFGCPFAIFYAITSLFLGYTLAVFLVAAFTFGFTTAAMLIPALFEFDVATGRTTGGEE